MIRAVVFDFDGVIANSEPLHFRAYRDVLGDRGITLTESAYYERYLGYDDVGAFRAIASDGGVPLTGLDIEELVRRKAVRLEALENDGSILFPGARDAVVRMAEKWPVAIASGALKPEILRVLQYERLSSHVPIVVSAEDTLESKPDPAPYRLAVAMLGADVDDLRPAQCVAIEDSRWGLISARRAGLRTVGITHTYSAVELADAADVVIAHLDHFTPELLLDLDR